MKFTETSMKRIYKLCIGIAVVLLIAAALFRFSSKSVKAEQTEASLQPVAVAVVQRGPIVNSLTLSGVFRPYQQVDVHAKVAGYIKQIYVDVGDKVKEGQVLATLEIPELQAQVLGADATIKRSQDSIHRAQSEILRAESTYAANHSAYTRLKQASDARSGLIAEQELDDALAKDQESQAQVES